jgi:uncharacterized membrane protein YphA (DoxX/SURF4 family)
MKIVAGIQRIMLGLIFLASGINHFVHPGHASSFGTQTAREYMTVMQATPYGHVLYGLEIVCSVLLIAGVFVPVALTILAGYIFNIYMFRIFLDPSLSPWPAIVTVLWILTFVRYRHAFRALLLPRAPLRNLGEE